MPETIDKKSKEFAYELFDIYDTLEIGTTKGLQQIHAYLFCGLYDFAGQIRTFNISKGGFCFAPVMFLKNTLKIVEEMTESNFGEIVDKYVEMNIAHPFMEGNGRSTRIWLDLILKKNLSLCVNWTMISKEDYFLAMAESPIDSSRIKNLLQSALSDRIHDRKMYIMGIDCSYYYEE